MRKLALEAVFYGLKHVFPSYALNNFCTIEDRRIILKDELFDLRKFHRIFLVSVGKVSCPMAKFFLEKLDFDDGFIATNADCDLDFNVFYSSHPLPNEQSIKAADKLIELLEKSKEDDLFIFLISGGASSIIEKPVIDFGTYVKIMDFLLKNDFSIDEINIVRKGLSCIKGGKILRKTHSTVLSFIISDVIGDDLSTIGSGLTYFDRFTQNDFDKLKNRLPFDLENIEYDTLTKKEFDSKRVSNFIIASNSVACKKVKEFLESAGFEVMYLGSQIKGNIDCVADLIGGIFKDSLNGNIGLKKPYGIVFGGETTVNLTKSGKGGRNQHLALSIAKRLSKVDDNFCFMAVATDGKDGNSNNGGAIVDNSTFKRALEKNLNIDKFLLNFDSATFFERLSDNLVFRSDTNVADMGLFLSW